MRTGTVLAPLHGGHCPPWLFQKMKQLSAAIIQVIVYEYGPAEVLRRLADPVWFQAFGCVVGFDWHSSGLTTVLCGALKEGLVPQMGELGLFFAGGKGRAARQTPQEIYNAGARYALQNDLAALERTSKMDAKVDAAAVQDGYQLYHHFFVFDRQGHWAVVQQGMNDANRYARRYHWRSEGLAGFTENPHTGICGHPEKSVLNLVSADNRPSRLASVELCREKPALAVNVLRTLQSPPDGGLFTEVSLPRAHPIPSPRYLNKILYQIYAKPPASYEQLLATPGVGASTLRALAMVAEVTHGATPSYSDPVRYAFAHGGKDSYPFPVNRRDMDRSLLVLRTALEKAKIGERDKLDALKRLARPTGFPISELLSSADIAPARPRFAAPAAIPRCRTASG